MTQPDPATVRAVLAKHDDDKHCACETCVLIDHVRYTEATLVDHASETCRIRELIARWANDINPQLGYSGRWVQEMLNKILTGTYE